MSLGYGLAAVAAQLGIESILIKPRRAIGPFSAYVTISERHHDDLDIVDHPVEVGAQVSDHAYMRPPEVTIECALSNSPHAGGLLGLGGAITGTIGGVQSIITGNSPDQVKEVYSRMRELQRTAELITVVTGKRTYEDMLIKSLTVETDHQTEHVLRVTVNLRQVMRVTVREVLIGAPAEEQADPQATLPPVDKGMVNLGVSIRGLSPAEYLDDLIEELMAKP